MTRLDVPTPAPETATDGLGRDSELLVAALNEVLEEQVGRVFASRVQWLFRTAAAVREDEPGAGERLVGYLPGVPGGAGGPIIRACSLGPPLGDNAEGRGGGGRRGPDHPAGGG